MFNSLRKMKVLIFMNYVSPKLGVLGLLPNFPELLCNVGVSIVTNFSQISKQKASNYKEKLINSVIIEINTIIRC
jgi:hypothetical protein